MEPEFQLLHQRALNRDSSLVSELKNLKPSHFPEVSTRLRFAPLFFKLGLYREGLSFLDLSDAKAHRDQRLRDLALLWGARLLNGAGARSLACDLVQRVSNIPVELLPVVAGIYLSSGFFKEALQHFNTYFESGATELLVSIGRIDALIGLEQYEKALADWSSIDQSEAPPLHLGILHEQKAEILIGLGLFEEAWEELTVSDELIPTTDQSVDRAFLEKWKGYCLAKLQKDPKEAEQAFSRARKILSKKGRAVNLEAHLDLLRWKVGLLSDEDAHTLSTHPAVSKKIRSELRSADKPKPDHKDSVLKIYPRSGEVFFSGKYSLRLGKEVEFLSILSLSGHWGIGTEELKSLLWAKDLFSYTYMGDRLNQILYRLKRYHVISIERLPNGRLRLSDPSLISVDSEKTRPSFLEGRRTFSGAEFSEYYSIGKTQRQIHLAKWLENSWIRVLGCGSATHYEVI